MDCNIKCCTLLLLVALLATCVCTERSCLYGMKTSGYTDPSGDILLEFGKPLEINCTIYPSPSYNSSFLTFFGLGREIPKQYLSIVNRYTLRLYIPKPEIQAGAYKCVFKTEVKNTSSGVCLNRVTVGLRPQKVSNFTCISRNWNNLNCSWIPPDNNIKTNYYLSYSLKSRIWNSCPNNTETALNSCYWDDSTSPSYRPAHKDYKFNLTASNIFGTETWFYNVNNYASVVPDKPRNLSCISTTVTSITLKWFIPSGLEHFPLGLIHKVEYKTDYEDWQEVDSSSLCVADCSAAYLLVLHDLKYANTMFTIRVQSRVGKNDVASYRWSEPAYIFPTTNATIPGAPPQTNVGSFEIVSTNSYGLRDINLYWKEIPKQWENGNDFQYKIILVEENGDLIDDIVPSEISSYYALYKNLTDMRYRFEIVSWNNMGRSIKSSEIIVPAESEMPPSPEQVTQIPFNSGTYELSWGKPSIHTKISSYNIFWCKNKSNRPYQCSGNLNWTVVGSDINVKNITNLMDSQVYQLGVSANRGGLSSGIAWASCTVQPDRVGRLKRPSLIHAGSTYIHISWKLECSNKVGLVSGFQIEYFECSYNCSNETCNSQQNCGKIIVEERDKRAYNITGLKPQTWYSISISIKSKSDGSLKSDPLIEETKEGVPDIIADVEVTNVTSTSISLKWSPPENTNGVLLHYIVEGGRGHPNILINNTSFTLDELDSLKEYSISVKGCTSTGCGLPSKPLRVTTLVGPPKVPFNIQLISINSSIAVLNWTRPPATAGNLTYYTVKFQVISNENVKFNYEVNVTNHKVELPWKSCENDGATKYKLWVRAVNMLEDGSVLEGLWSHPQEGTCILTTTPPHLTVIIPLGVVLLSILLCIFCALFSQHLWDKFNRMRDIGVKLPARLRPRQEDKSENNTTHFWNNHIAREEENTICIRPSPDEQSLLKVKEEIEMIQEDLSTDRESFGCDIQNSTVSGDTIPVANINDAPASSPSPGYILISPQPQPSGYVTIPPPRGYILALPSSPNPAPVSPQSLPQCSMSLKQNGLSPISPKPFNSFPEPNHYGDMVSPINST